MSGNKSITDPTSMKIWLVGGSQGIGLSLCEKLLHLGHQLVVSSRNAKSSEILKKLKQDFPQQLEIINLDVTDAIQIDQVVEEVIAHLGKIDLWFYNAGIYKPIQINNWDLQAFEQTNAINYLGAVRLMIALRTHFLEQNGGRWIWNVSLAADFGLPYGGAYSAPKAALMNLAESIAPELAERKIRLQIINHGFVKTRLTAKNDFAMLGLMETTDAADKIIKVIHSNKFETRFPWNLAFILSTLKRLPKQWSLAITKKMLKKKVSD